MAETNGRYEATGNELVTGEVVDGNVAQDTPPETDPNSPSFITPKARTIIYLSSLGVTVATGLGTGIALIVGGITGDQATEIQTLVYGAVALVNTSLAVGFRPTRPALVAARNRG